MAELALPSLQATAIVGSARGLLIKTAYTYSKAIDMADDDGRTGLLFN